MKSFRDYLELSNSCSYDVDDVIGRADRFGFQNFCSPGLNYLTAAFYGYGPVAFLRLIPPLHRSTSHNVGIHCTLFP